MMMVLVIVYIGIGTALWGRRMITASDDILADPEVQIVMYVIGVPCTTLLIGVVATISLVSYMVAWPLKYR